MTAEHHHDSGDDDLVTVTSCASEFEAATKVAVLQDAGIEAFAFGSVHASLPLGQKFLSVPVQVRLADVERARAALDDNRKNAPSIDWDSVDVGEREDALPLKPVGRMPLAALVGYLTAIVFILVTVIMIIWWLAQPPFGWSIP